MTREEAIDIIKCLAWHTRPDEEDVEQAIKALEQEPTTRNCFGCKYSKDNHRAGTEECHLCMWENQYTPTTKNDLGVDCIDRQATLDAIIKRLGIRNESYLLQAERVLYQQIKDMPAVAPQPRKGHWVLTDVEGYRVWHCNCSECGKDPQNYVGGSENWWLIKNNLPKFCPNCGSENREVKE